MRMRVRDGNRQTGSRASRHGLKAGAMGQNLSGRGNGSEPIRGRVAMEGKQTAGVGYRWYRWSVLTLQTLRKHLTIQLLANFLSGEISIILSTKNKMALSEFSTVTSVSACRRPVSEILCNAVAR